MDGSSESFSTQGFIQATTANHLEAELEMKLIYYCCSDPRLSLDRCKNWGPEGKSDLSKDIQQDCGKARTRANPQICFTLHRQVRDTTDTNHYKNVEKFKFHRDHEKSIIPPAEHSKEVLISPPRRRLEGSEVRGSSMPRAESKVGGKLYLTMGEFLNSVSQMKQTTGCLFSRTREEVSLPLTSHLRCFPSANARGLVQVHHCAGLKYKQTLFPCLVQSQAIKQALEISNLIRKKKKKNLLRLKSKTLSNKSLHCEREYKWSFTKITQPIIKLPPLKSNLPDFFAQCYKRVW